MTSLTLPAWSAYAVECGRVRRLLVGFSGGVDSTVLLHLARQWSSQSGLPLLAIHVNHQLSPFAHQWQQHCQAVCEQWGVPFHAETVQVQNSGQGLEAAARNARYAAFARIVGAGDLLLLGHHRDDQVETVLQRLFRGSGVLGLRGMDVMSPWREAHLLRPLLSWGKRDLVDFARRQGWSWVEDDSNARDDFDRNFLRRQVLPVLAQRWPSLPIAVQRSARHCDEAQGLLDELAKSDLLPRVDDVGGLSFGDPDLAVLSPARQRNLIRYWLRCQGLSLPSETQLEQILTAVIPASADATPVVQWSGAEVRRHGGVLHALRPLAPVPVAPTLFEILESGEYPVASGGIVTVQTIAADAGIPQVASLARLRQGRLTLRYRQGGERCKLVGRPTRPLKKILQESDLAPWWRDRLPLVYVDAELAIIPGIGVSEGFQAGPSEAGVRFGWRPPRLPQAWRD